MRWSPGVVWAVGVLPALLFIGASSDRDGRGVVASPAASDLSISKRASPNPVLAGSNLTYTIVVANNGPDGASSVTVRDTLPSSTNFVSCSSTAGGVCGGSAGKRTISFSSLAAGASATITLVAKVKSSVASGATLTNRAHVASSGSSDPNAANNSSSAAVTVTKSKADLAVTKSGSPNPIQSGSNVTYTVLVSNGGPGTATSVTLTDTLPSSTTFVSCTSTGGGSCGGTGNARTVTFPSLASAASATVTLVATVKSNVAGGTVISNTARVASAASDPASANNAATATVTTTGAPADLAVSKSGSPDPVQSGSNVTYTILVSNGGPGTATSVTLTDTLPSSTTFVSCTSTGGGSCGGTGNARTVTFSSLASGASATVTLVATVGASVADRTVIVNRAHVSASSPADPESANNSASAMVTVVAPGTDLAISNTASPDPIEAGWDATYTLTVHNNGSSAAASVTVTDSIPEFAIFNSCTSTGGGVCGGSGDNERTITFASLAAGAAETVTLTARTDAEAPSGTVIRNKASVSFPGSDTQLSNNSATSTMTTYPPYPNTYHVAKSGSDANPGTLVAPLLTVQRAVNLASPGDILLVHPGTYDGTVSITRSGKPDLPILLQPAEEATVTLTATLVAELCTRASPTFARTVRVMNGNDYWTIRGFQIVNGVGVYGTNLAALQPYVRKRSLPGRSTSDPDSAETTLQSLGSDPADHVEILGNRISRRGIHLGAARWTRIEDNEVYDIDCGTGGGMWIGSFSDFSLVRGNYVHDIKDSNGNHWMTEGIRVGTNSMYGTIELNIVERTENLGRGFAMDANGGWHVIRNNRASETDIGFSEQKGGWGNSWLNNLAVANRRSGFRVGPGDTSAPSEDTPRYITMRCNQSINNPNALFIGSAVESTWENNDFPTVQVASPWLSYWPSSGNTWDGSSDPPPTHPSNPRFTDCPAAGP